MKAAILALLCMLGLARGASTFERALPFFRSQGGSGGSGGLPLASGLVAYWPMETVTGGVTPDVTGDGFDLSGGGTISVGGGIISNYFGSASSYISNADNSTLGIGAGKSFTIQAWADQEGGFLFAGKWREDDSTKRDYQIGTIPGMASAAIMFRVYNLANTQVIVTNNVIFKVAEVGHWIHVVAGYDDSLQQIWIQVNNGPRIIAPCVGVRRTSAPFVIGNDPSLAYGAGLKVDEAAFWTRSLTAQNVADAYNNHNAVAYPLTVTTPGVASPVATNSVMNNWISAVVSDNATFVTGFYVPNVEMIPICRFWNAIVAAGLDTKMKAVNIMAYQYFSGAIISDNHALAWPLYDIHGVGSARWGAYGGFNPIQRSITINGAASDQMGLDQYMPTDINPSTDASSQTSFGQSIYAYDNNHDGTDAGTETGGTLSVRMAVKFSDGNYYFDNGAVGNRITGVSTPLLGFYSDNRVSGTDHKVYFANSGTGFAQFGSTDSTLWAGTYPNLAISLFAYNGAGQFTFDRLSYYSAHDGFSAADAQTEYNLVQAFLVEKGGGFH